MKQAKNNKKQILNFTLTMRGMSKEEDVPVPVPKFSELGSLAWAILFPNVSNLSCKFNANTESNVKFATALTKDMKDDEEEEKSVVGSFVSKYHVEENNINFLEKWTTENKITTGIEFEDVFQPGLNLGTAFTFSTQTDDKELGCGAVYKNSLCHLTSELSYIMPSSGKFKANSVVEYLPFLIGAEYVHDLEENKMIDHGIVLGYKQCELRVNATYKYLEEAHDANLSAYYRFPNQHLALAGCFEFNSKENDCQLCLGARWYVSTKSYFQASFSTSRDLYCGYQVFLTKGVTVVLNGKLSKLTEPDYKMNVGLGVEFEV